MADSQMQLKRSTTTSQQLDHGRTGLFRRARRLLLYGSVCLWLIGILGGRGAAQSLDDLVFVPTQPLQPVQGPGSSEYPHGAIQMSKHGQGARQYWLFTPKDPTPAKAPVIVLLHGWGATDPTAYGAWIKHLVRRGNVVIYPRYQEGLGTRPNSFTDHAVSAIRAALARLESDGPVQPDLDKVAFVGHSMGAIMSANMAQNAERLQVPRPQCLLLAEPAFEPILGRYDQIPSETLLVVVVGRDVKRDASAERILAGTTQIPLKNKNYVALASDRHGNPPLVSDHFAPCAADELEETPSQSPRGDWHGRTRDALDFYGYWKICDGLLDAAWTDTNRDFALGDTAEVRFMGRWSDGVSIEPATVLAWE